MVSLDLTEPRPGEGQATTLAGRGEISINAHPYVPKTRPILQYIVWISRTTLPLDLSRPYIPANWLELLSAKN